jgi:hypothetical protein
MFVAVVLACLGCSAGPHKCGSGTIGKIAIRKTRGRVVAALIRILVLREVTLVLSRIPTVMMLIADVHGQNTTRRTARMKYYVQSWPTSRSLSDRKRCKRQSCGVRKKFEKRWLMVSRVHLAL